MIQRLSAITFAVRDMPTSVSFYSAFGFTAVHGGPDATFTSLHMGEVYVNLTLRPDHVPAWWGRAIFYVDDVDALYQAITAQGLTPANPPRDASWGERFFHIVDPDGNELSFAKPLIPSTRTSEGS
jgi:catechol 2,3-dioxygenase-like lactoylglutathione lyase family enzyme